MLSDEQELVHRLVTGATTAAAAPATLTARHVHGQCCGVTVEGSGNGKKKKKMNNDKWADTGAGPSAPTDYYEEILSSLKQRKASDKKKLLQVRTYVQYVLILTGSAFLLHVHLFAAQN